MRTRLHWENYEAALALAEELKDKKITVKMKAGEGGRTFGSVSTKEIAAAAKEQLGMEARQEKDAGFRSRSEASA